ncbi:MAG: TIGR02281 family clan AA aspartic protease [Novosphingobium sp.]
MTGIGELAIAQPLLMLAIVAVLAAAAGWMIEHDRPALGRALRSTGYLGMLAAGLLLVGQTAHQASRSDAKLLLGSRPSLTIAGTSTVIPLSGDGHFWIRALVNGREVDFLVDTGATYTSLSDSAADLARLEPDNSKASATLNTANGVIEARFARIEEMRFGTITARQLDAIILPGASGSTNVIGMNLLSQLGSWRVENDQLILEPKG